ncbi:MAG: 4Fe-4S dicluster domain-containing protein [Anaerolineae bacterium]
MATEVADSVVRESDLGFGEEAIRHRKELLECIQCGTCSASCPTAYAMDHTPRQIIAALRADQLENVLRSNTPWLCASCYYCTVRCPAGIQFTDFMYLLKRMAVERGLHPPGSPALYQAFVNTVDRYGRSAETELMIRYFLSTLNPLGLIKLAPFGLKMLLRGRFPLLPHRIKGRRNLARMLEHIEEKGGA